MANEKDQWEVAKDQWEMAKDQWEVAKTRWESPRPDKSISSLPPSYLLGKQSHQAEPS